MRYIIIKGKRQIPLSYFFGNGNGKIKDIIGFSSYNYIIFESKEKALNYIKYMKREIRNREDFDLKLSIKLFNLFDKLKVIERKYKKI